MQVARSCHSSSGPFGSGRTAWPTATSPRGSSTAPSEALICGASTCSAVKPASSSTRDAGRKPWRQLTRPATSSRCSVPPAYALAVLGLVRARRGDPDVWAPLDEALALAVPTGELLWLGRSLRRGRRLLARRTSRGRQAGNRERPRARRGSAGAVGSRRARLLAPASGCWTSQSRSSRRSPTPRRCAATRSLLHLWTALGCPYEAALALADADEVDLLAAHSPAATARCEGRRRDSAPPTKLGNAESRGPRRAARANPAQVHRASRGARTRGTGTPQPEIAERLFLSRRSEEDPTSAILRKLGVRTRGEAIAAATRLALLEDT